MAPRSRRWFWRYGLFLGAAVGLLAKGPLVLVLAGGAVLPWLLFSKQGWPTLGAQPWWSGTLLTLLITLPWYVAAEIKTPGFLYYFLVGEHFLRFVEPGWGGDLYGGAHDHPRGAIWLYYLVGAFPWVLWLGKGVRKLRFSLPRPMTLYFLGWALSTPVFFSLSGNILWTYVLPALPAFSVLIAGLVTSQASSKSSVFWRAALPAIGPVVMVLLCVALLQVPEQIKSDKQLVEYVKQSSDQHEVAFVGEPTYSMRFYTQGAVTSITAKELQKRVASDGGETLPPYLAIPNRNRKSLPSRYKLVMSSKGVGLYQLQYEQLALDEETPEPHGKGEIKESVL